MDTGREAYPAVAALTEGKREEGKRLADHLGVPFYTGEEEIRGLSMALFLDDTGLTLVSGSLSLKGDFRRMLRRITGGRLDHELLVKAARRKNFGPSPRAVDATAGLGEDSVLLAAAGFHVTLCEYNPVTAALLKDAHARALEDPELCVVAGRMEVVETDSVSYLASLREAPDLILLDPMFPARQKNALTVKKLQLLQKLEKPCAGEEALLNAAIQAGPEKIIIKRPLKGPYLAGRKPGYSIEGKTIRYDCLVFPRT
ncbi:MAG: class I SAM-dependent methyltransferase [Lachnospiraceae bacterium]|nr:class I SAM-dependent methyltransferase [Lachnospiraceae bacterium]